METTSSPNRTLGIVAIGAGGLLLAASLCALLTFLLVPFLQPQNALVTNTSVMAIGAVALVYGATLLWVGMSIRKNQPSAPFRLPSPLILFAVFVLAILVGQAILSFQLAPPFLFPPFHVLAALCVPLTTLAFVAPRLHPVSTRSVLGQFAWGGIVTIALALVFELLIGGVLIFLAFLVVYFGLGGERATELMNELRGVVDAPQQLFEIVAHEPFILIVAALTAMGLFVIIVPLLEELLKASGSAIAITRRERAHATPSKSEVVLWGLAAGAGFAFTENLFNGQGGLNATSGVVSFWAAGMGLRVGTSLMHMVATATVAVGFYFAISQKNRKRFVQLLALALLAHAAWNSGAVLLGGVSALTQVNPNLEIVSACLVIAMLLLLVGLLVAFSFWLWRLIRWATPPVEIVSTRGIILETKG